MTEMPEPQVDDEVLGPCGCYDYHMADCPLKTGSYGRDFENDYDRYYDGEY